MKCGERGNKLWDTSTYLVVHTTFSKTNPTKGSLMHKVIKVYSLGTPLITRLGKCTTSMSS